MYALRDILHNATLSERRGTASVDGGNPALPQQPALDPQNVPLIELRSPPPHNQPAHSGGQVWRVRRGGGGGDGSRCKTSVQEHLI